VRHEVQEGLFAFVVFEHAYYPKSCRVLIGDVDLTGHGMRRIPIESGQMGVFRPSPRSSEIVFAKDFGLIYLHLGFRVLPRLLRHAALLAKVPKELLLIWQLFPHLGQEG
jgi:hypothetical protein